MICVLYNLRGLLFFVFQELRAFPAGLLVGCMGSGG